MRLDSDVVKNRWATSLSGRWTEGFRWSAGVFQGNVDEYTTIDFSASFQINEALSIGLNIANAEDNIHRQTFGGDLLTRRGLINLTYRQ